MGTRPYPTKREKEHHPQDCMKSAFYDGRKDGLEHNDVLIAETQTRTNHLDLT